MTQDNPRMGDLNELVERLESWSSETINQWADEYEPRHAWVKQVSQAMKKWSEASDEAAAALTSLMAERDGLRGADAKRIYLAETNRDDWRDRALTAEAQLKAAREALNNIRELNMSGVDDAGHRWANSDLIEQEIATALSPDTNKGDGV